MADPATKIRADAQANRIRLLEVAREELTADPSASLNSIGKAAGVGAGTLYRHFPTREALIIAVYRKEIEELVQSATTLLTKNPPLQAFLRWCGCLARAARTKQGIAAALQSTIIEDDTQAALLPIMEATGKLLKACRDADAIWPGIDEQDFLTLVSFLWKISPDAAGEARAKRLLGFVFRGMGADVDVVGRVFGS
jgi:AcrR family transcriptional regulator